MPTPGPLELVIILVIALLVLGPGRLPEVGSALGKSLREFRKASSDIQESVKVDTSPLPPDQAASQQPAPPAVAAAPVVAAAPAPVAQNAPAAAPVAPAAPIAVAAVADTQAAASAAPVTAPTAAPVSAPASAPMSGPDLTPTEEVAVAPAAAGPVDSGTDTVS